MVQKQEELLDGFNHGVLLRSRKYGVEVDVSLDTLNLTNVTNAAPARKNWEKY